MRLMENLILDLCILCVSIFLIFVFFTRKKLSSQQRNLPPGRTGLPFIGEMWDFVMANQRGCPEKFINDRTSKHSKDAFKTRLLGENMVVFCGPAGNKILFSNEDKCVVSWWPSSVMRLLAPADVDNSAEITNKVRESGDKIQQMVNLSIKQMEIADSKGEGELLSWDDLKKMKYTWWVACETLRLLPPGGTFREVIADFTFAGYTIPKGWKAYWTPSSTHKNPTYFPDPEKFDPLRYEGSGPAPYTYVPFGGGPRMCPGKEFARTAILVFIHNVITKFKVKMENSDEKITYQLGPVPVDGLLVKLISIVK